MPYKFHEPRRHHIPGVRYRVMNGPEYERGLVRRGDIRFWIGDDALAAWWAPRRWTRGGQSRFSDLVIEAVLTSGSVFDLALRQMGGFIRSLPELMALLDLPLPDHGTLVRRRRALVDLVLDGTGPKFFGAREWDRVKHGYGRRSLVESAISRIKRLRSDGRLSTRSPGGQYQQIELVIVAANRMIRDAKPVTVRV